MAKIIDDFINEKKFEVIENIGEATAEMILDIKDLQERVNKIESFLDMKVIESEKETKNSADRNEKTALQVLHTSENSEKSDVKKKMFQITVFGFNTPEEFDKTREIMDIISEKDETFTFKPTFTMESEDKDLLHRKGLWLVKKITDIQNLKYTVIQK